MAGLEALTSLIYHERQQPGSMLCAQHALNSLLQGNYFTAPDLAHIANSVDSLERESLDESSYEDASANMDDTGFFSVQVIEKALKVWGLNLVRWRSEQMRPYNQTPHTQLAFVLNLQQHWFTLRRFGPALPNIDLDPGEGHWYNLNSSLMSPEWIGRLYLGMVLQQMESDGYSVFAVCQADPQAPLALPRTDADTIAATLEEAPDQVGRTSDDASMDVNVGGSLHHAVNGDEMHGLEDEDMELQAALQASLMGGEYPKFNVPVQAPALRRAPPPPTAASGPPLQDTYPNSEGALGLDGMDAADPVAASMARNKAIMDRMRREQEAALRESYEEEMARFGGSTGQQQPFAPPPGGSGMSGRTPAELQEEEATRRAIAESRSGRTVDDEDLDDEDYVSPGRTPTAQQFPSQLFGQPSAGPAVESGPRVYDDDDEELQAALKASLESAPEGFTIPSSSSRVVPARGIEAVSVPASAQADDEEDMSERMSSPPPAPPTVDVDEMRKRRLARFGG